MKLTQAHKSTIPAPEKLVRKWFIVDIAGKTLGETAVKIANIIRGKDKTFFTPQHDCGDFVVVINAKDVRLAGNKVDTKLYQWHTRYPSGFRQRTARQILDKKPEKVIFDAVWGMLPRNKLRHAMMKKLKVFPGTEHEHAAQAPQIIEL